MRAAGGEERGAATVLATALAAVLVACAVTAVAGGRVLVDDRRADVAADLAALAGAAAVQRGAGGCAVAERVAAANDAVLTACRVAGEEVRVEVRTDSLTLLGIRARPRAEARAGPTSG